MHISVRGARDRKYTKIVKQAIAHFATHLFGSRMLNNLSFTILFQDDLTAGGFCGPSPIADLSRPRDFEIEVSTKGNKLRQITTLAHEMVHAKQFAYGQLRDKLVKREFVTTWNGVVYGDDVDYWDHPWEQEAYGLENTLVAKFLQATNYYEYFDTETDVWYPASAN